jgi:hypothetical protein
MPNRRSGCCSRETSKLTATLAGLAWLLRCSVREEVGRAKGYLLLKFVQAVVIRVGIKKRRIAIGLAYR